ncbi:hypothetical protein FNF27_04922 [Cafeteria roenbergensis]|uniref:Thioredoxin domain-containing protein n=2 Tax=Cafeteria roenbergensis TaxID=33653 RepID=A0A5A8E8F1_CAFRO|nr:hypothetical protein FNF27_04922 [Cafeteria roenbergensis]
MASESASMLEGHVTVNDTAEFDAVLAAQTEAAAGKPVYAVFVGTPKPETGKSWCPDCVTAEPVIIATLADREGGARVMWCNVLRSEYKDHPEYPYRTHKLISLTSVPTVVKYVDGKVRAACVDDDCSKAARVRALLEA